MNAKPIDFFKTDFFQFRTRYLISGLSNPIYPTELCVFSLHTKLGTPVWIRYKHDTFKTPRLLTEGRLTLKILQPFLGWKCAAINCDAQV